MFFAGDDIISGFVFVNTDPFFICLLYLKTDSCAGASCRKRDTGNKIPTERVVRMLSDKASEKSNNIVEMLRVEGVDCKGFGIIPKALMTDTDLTIGAKALYAYLCSYTGKGNTAYPKRDKILSDLNICKTAYYRYQKELIDQGYIRVDRETTYPFCCTYTLVTRPEKLKEKIPTGDGTMIAGGIKAFGYGSIPKAVMVDKRVSVKAKALYAYFSSFAGNGSFAFPKTKDILYHLGISVNTLTTYMHELIGCNYITVVQKHDKGRFDRNTYFINDLPDEKRGQEELQRRAEYQEQKKAHSKGLVNLPTPKKDNQKEVKNTVAEALSVYLDNQYDKQKSQEIQNDREVVESRIKEQISYDYLCGLPGCKDYIGLILDVLIDAVTSKNETLRVNRQDLSTEVVRSRLFKLDESHIEYVLDSLSNITTMPKNLRAYLLTALYNSYTGIDPHYNLQVKHDFALK